MHMDMWSHLNSQSVCFANVLTLQQILELVNILCLSLLCILRLLSDTFDQFSMNPANVVGRCLGAFFDGDESFEGVQVSVHSQVELVVLHEPTMNQSKETTKAH